MRGGHSPDELPDYPRQIEAALSHVPRSKLQGEFDSEPFPEIMQNLIAYGGSVVFATTLKNLEKTAA